MRILFVCTGNICRSPMAEGIAKHMAGEAGRSDLEFASAGTGALEGLRASEHAIRVAEKNGIDLSEHRSRRLTKEALESADLIVPMEKAHVAAIFLLDPGAEPRIRMLYEFDRVAGENPRDVADPIGGDEARYRDSFLEIRRLVENLLARLEDRSVS